MPRTVIGPTDIEPEKLSRAELWRIFNARANRYLGVTGETFLRKWDEGEYRGTEDQYPVMRVAMLLPFVR